MNIKWSHIRLIIVLIGFTAVSSQVLFLREIMTIFHGNEISLGIVLAVWLIWTGTGSIVSGMLIDGWRSFQKLAGLLMMLLGGSMPATILVLRFSRPFAQAVSGELPGLGMLIIISVSVLSVFCLLSGALFALTARLYRISLNTGIAESVSAAYLWEVLGSGVGGLLMSILLIPYFSPLPLAAAIGGVNIVAGYYLLVRQDVIKSGSFRIILLLILCGCAVFFGTLERFSISRQWQGLRVIEQRQSRYGVLTVVRFSEMTVLYQNGIPAAAYPEQQTIEERIHFALLAHSDPEYVLLVGGGISGAIQECLKYPSVRQLDYVEMDPEMIKLGRIYFKEAWQGVESNAVVRTVFQDGRLYTRQSETDYDVIIVTVPEPATAQLNRFYTHEYFMEVRNKLNPGGILAIQLAGSENYISESLKQVLQCVNKTLQSVFGYIHMIPGSTIHIYATDDSLVTFHARHFIDEIARRNLSTEYVREYYIPFRFMPDRVDELRKISAPDQNTPLNTDLRPIAYYLSFIFWGSRFSHGFAFWKPAVIQAASVAFFTILLIILFILNRRYKTEAERIAAVSGNAVLVMGFSVMSYQLILLMAFEALYGYVYYQLSILISSFMLGMGCGTYVARKKRSVGIMDLPGIHLVLAVLPFILLLLFRLNHSASVYAAGPFVVFPLFTMVSGFAGGYQFPVAGRIYHALPGVKQNQGLLYGLDMAGGFLGALFIGSILIPVLGFLKIAVLIAAMNGLIALSMLIRGRRLPPDAILRQTQMPKT